MLPIFTSRRRRRLLQQPLSSAEQTAIEQGVAAYGALADEQKTKLRDIARVLAAEKHWEGCGGLRLNDSMKLVIAAQAALLLLGQDVDPIKDDLYPHSSSILVYPDKFVSAAGKQVGPGGVVTEGSTNLGEAWYNGPVILSWADARAGARNDTPGRNVVIHEFAHKLDMLDGSVNGTPPLDSAEQNEQWKLIMTGEFNRLARSARLGVPHALNTYGLHSPGEFFAVSTEAFFTNAKAVRDLHPELYELLRGYYKQDPAGWDASRPA